MFSVSPGTDQPSPMKFCWRGTLPRSSSDETWIGVADSAHDVTGEEPNPCSQMYVSALADRH